MCCCVGFIITKHVCTTCLSADALHQHPSHPISSAKAHAHSLEIRTTCSHSERSKQRLSTGPTCQEYGKSSVATVDGWNPATTWEIKTIVHNGINQAIIAWTKPAMTPQHITSHPNMAPILDPVMIPWDKCRYTCLDTSACCFMFFKHVEWTLHSLSNNLWPNAVINYLNYLGGKSVDFGCFWSHPWYFRAFHEGLEVLGKNIDLHTMKDYEGYWRPSPPLRTWVLFSGFQATMLCSWCHVQTLTTPTRPSRNCHRLHSQENIGHGALSRYTATHFKLSQDSALAPHRSSTMISHAVQRTIKHIPQCMSYLSDSMRVRIFGEVVSFLRLSLTSLVLQFLAPFTFFSVQRWLQDLKCRKSHICWTCIRNLTKNESQSIPDAYWKHCGLQSSFSMIPFKNWYVFLILCDHDTNDLHGTAMNIHELPCSLDEAHWYMSTWK